MPRIDRFTSRRDLLKTSLFLSSLSASFFSAATTSRQYPLGNSTTRSQPRQDQSLHRSSHHQKCVTRIHTFFSAVASTSSSNRSATSPVKKAIKSAASACRLSRHHGFISSRISARDANAWSNRVVKSGALFLPGATLLLLLTPWLKPKGSVARGWEAYEYLGG